VAIANEQENKTMQLADYIPTYASQRDLSEKYVRGLHTAVRSLHSYLGEGWRLMDDDGGQTTLTGSIPANGAMTIRLNVEKLQLGNDGDSVILVDATGKTVKTVTYPRTSEGRFVVPSRNFRDGE
jgi:hypothetical protein